ncbi:MAG: inositol monophosphatase [Sandaracinaceae bacterium]|nr:inositol monophosphatase [Sandaracinaceae bacterium]
MSFSFDLDRIGGRHALAALVDEVVGAGEDALRLYRGGAAARVQIKPDRSPVTEADQAVENRIRGYLAGRYPTAAFLGEETGASPESNASLRFVVDPIDGTRAFVRGIPTWSILVGLEADSVPSVGIAYFPATGDLYVGVRGDGATGNGRPLAVSSVRELADACICHGSLQQFTEYGYRHLLPKLGERTHTQRGFADFDGFRNVLHGRADAMVDPGVQPWDLCAAAVLVREAGGEFSSMKGEDTIFGRSALATNGHIHNALVALCNEPA